MGFFGDGDGGSVWCSTAREVIDFAAKMLYCRTRRHKIIDDERNQTRDRDPFGASQPGKKGESGRKVSSRIDASRLEEQRRDRQLTYFSSSAAPFNFAPSFLLLNFLGGSPTAGNAFGSLTFLGRPGGFFSFGTTIAFGLPPVFFLTGASSPSLLRTTPP